MNELSKTVIYASVAALLLGGAVWATWPDRDLGRPIDDQGEQFFPEFTIPEQAKTLEVAEVDPSTGESRFFKVSLKDGRWVIPSHGDYPADARDRLAQTASGILDLRKTMIRSDRRQDHREMGVLDPLDPKLIDLQGTGKRVTLRDASDAVLADLIIGKAVPNAEGQRFVRLPGKNRVYAVNLENVEISSRFSDWIETNLLQLQASDVRQVMIDNHKIDPEQQTIQLGEILTVERPDSGTDWTLTSGKVPVGKELNTEALTTLTSTLANLQIVGVRPKPAGLTRELKASAEKGISLDQGALLSLASKGFHLVQGRLMSNEGDVYVTTAEGVEYTLRFGEVTFAQGRELSAGSEDEKAGSSDEAPPSEDGAVESRYLFVTAMFNPASVPKPNEEGPYTEEFPEDVFARDPAERDRLTQQKLEAAERAQEEYDKKLAEGK
ncbi:MAG TPA: DUF4340 domain-containing protein, partial [Isosphaeraceae bacterium]|nr:DUF4340 domain-containing protein [Isosphaeraceae bacterium]